MKFLTVILFKLYNLYLMIKNQIKLYKYLSIKHKNGKYILDGIGIFYWKNGLQHCENGPAEYIFNKHKAWFINGKLHRLDGPAIEWSDGRVEYYINGKHYFKNEYFEALDLIEKGLQYCE